MIKAVAFDIDGTLYNQFSFSWRCIPFVVKHLRFMLHFGRTRKELHAAATRGTVSENFFELQAKLIAEKLHDDPEKIKLFIEKEIYEGWRPLFAAVKPYRNVYQTITALKSAGYKIGLMSDFPPAQKNDVWGIAALSDVILSSEELGVLKPHKKPFLVLSEKLNTPPEEILYVGNSYRYDVLGAQNVGMKTALICNVIKKLFSKNKADIMFSNYRELQSRILQL